MEVAAPEGLIEAEKAREAFFAGHLVQLVYQAKRRPGGGLIGPRQEAGPTELMLVYQLVSADPDVGAGSYGIDAFTGQPVSATGAALDYKAMEEKLSGHWAGGELRLALANMWIDPASLDPDGAITRTEALNMLLSLSRELQGYYGRVDRAVPYKDIPESDARYELVREGIGAGMLRPEGEAARFGGDEELSRAELALWTARLLGLGDLARSELKTEAGFADLGGLTAEQRNAVAFLEALGILPSGGRFRGEAALTQAEAAAMAVRFLVHLQTIR